MLGRNIKLFGEKERMFVLGGKTMFYPTTKEEKWATWLLLQDIPGIGPGRIKSLYDKTGSLLGLLQAVYNNEFNNSWVQAIKTALIKPDLSKYLTIVENTYYNNAQICSLDDDIYPPI